MMCSELFCFVFMAQSPLTEKDRARSRAVDLDVTVRAICVLRVQVVLWTRRLVRADTVGRAVTRQAKLGDAAGNQQSWIRRTVRRVTRDTAVGLHRRMLVNERSLLVCVALDASSVSARRESRLLEFKAAMRIVTIAALHRAFKHFVMERQVELVLRLRMTTETKLRLAHLEHFDIGETRLLRVCARDEHIRSRELTSAGRRVRRVAVSATDVVAPVLATAEVVVFFPAGVTGQTRFRDLF